MKISVDENVNTDYTLFVVEISRTIQGRLGYPAKSGIKPKGKGENIMRTYFEVAIGKSRRMDGTPSPDFTCGHRHKSAAAAEGCQKKLIGYDPKSRVCSAKWYSSFINMVESKSARAARMEARQDELKNLARAEGYKI